ncbi:hypothetical protein L6164_036571 [Bauhinia variegata]|uniref:Uncharacterized protein n=1 Tax=Bauhinia variegata TaxID=167791 RepID=A0ACB9KHI1_BAUVA|nr:hypothetical protein L6164_036571 [Bauhinia variegata]
MEEEGQLYPQNDFPNEDAAHSEPSKQDYSFPVLQLDGPPQRIYHFHRQFKTPTNPNNFLKGVKWSPDGSCFLASSDDNTFRVFSLPDHESDILHGAYSVDLDHDSFAANLVLREGESIYDFCWYPFMSASDPVTNVFATTTRDHPIHLWDATSGQLRCTYRAYDAMDEIAAAFSVAFNPDGSKIFAGYNKCIRVFDLHRPGRDFHLHSTVKDNKEGQTGIISAMAFSPSHTGMLALSSYNQSTAIYREDNMELLYVLHGQEGGITHVLFSRDGNYLYTGGRKDPYILCWDVRKAVDCVFKLYRSSENTNQRILFDIEPSGQYLGTGGQDGLVHLYDLQTGQWASAFQAALDTVNGFSFHPFLPLAVSSSGHRRFLMPDEDDEDLRLSGDENCASVWRFNYASSMPIDTNDDASFNNQSEHGNSD